MGDTDWSGDPLFVTAPPFAGPDEDRFTFGQDLPAELIAYYAAEGYTTIGGIVMYHPPDEYEWIILALNAAGRGTICIGTRNTAGLVDCMQIRASAGLPLPRISFGEFVDNPGIMILESLFDLTFGARVTADPGAEMVGNTGATFLWVDMRHASDEQTTASTRAVTTYANLTNIAGTDFIAPASGTVTIHYTARLSNNSATSGAALTPWVGEGGTVGAGTEVLAASDANMLLKQEVSSASRDYRFGGQKPLSGLTPGDTYNVSMRGRAVTAGTATFDDITTTVIPSP